MAKKMSISSLLLAGAAAYGAYRLSKMSAQERTDLVSKGKKLVTDNLGNLKNAFGKQGSTPNPTANGVGESVTLGS